MGGGLITGRQQAAYRLKLARGFLEEARQDAELSRWRSAVDGSQLAVENAGKAVLALAGQIGRTHNPAPQIRRLIGEKQFNEAASKKLERLAELAELLGPDIHVQTGYGDEVEDRTPWEPSTKPTLTRLSPLRRKQWASPIKTSGRVAVSNSGPSALELHCHEVTARFLEKAVVPPYEGSMIRGAFGRAFKESCCPFPHDGDGCPLGDKCPYGYVFETSPPEGAREFAKNREVPRPYVFEPPEETKMEYEPGEEMRFGFTVVGRAADYMPYFIYAFSKMGEEGVGRLKARYRLERVVAKNPLVGTQAEIFDGEVVRNKRLPTVWEDAVSAARELDGERLRLEFLTPTFVKFKGSVSPEAPSFAALVQALLIRIPMLSAVHCGEIWREDFRELVERAAEVETVQDETTWVSFRRYSSFKKKSEPLEGVVGGVEYAGPVEEFLPLICVGQLTHLGKRAVFGLGRYRIVEV